MSMRYFTILSPLSVALAKRRGHWGKATYSECSDLPTGRGIVVGAEQDLARLRTLRRPHHTVRFHDLDQARRARVAELETALQVRGRGLTGGEHHAHGVVVLDIVEVLDPVDAALLFDDLRDPFEELRLALILFHELDDGVDFPLGDVRAVNTADVQATLLTIYSCSVATRY